MMLQYMAVSALCLHGIMLFLGTNLQLSWFIFLCWLLLSLLPYIIVVFPSQSAICKEKKHSCQPFRSWWNSSDFYAIFRHSDRNNRIPPKLKKIMLHNTLKTTLNRQGIASCEICWCKRCILSNIVSVILLPVTAFVIGCWVSCCLMNSMKTNARWSPLCLLIWRDV